MYEWIDSLRFLICLLFLSVASIHDIKTREVPNSIWLFFAPIGSILTLISLALNNWSILLIRLCVMSIAIIAGLSFTLFYLGLFGGADAKALICLAFSMPTYPNMKSLEPLLKPYSQAPLPPLSAFNNAVLMASLLVFTIIIKNLVDLIRNDGRIFDGLEREKTATKILAFLTGFRVEAHKLRARKHHYIILEKFSREGDDIIRSLKVFQRVSDGERSIPEEIDGKVWVTIGLPFLVFITIGFMLAIFVGDLALLLVDAVI
ncbi:prepilin peptidase [Candidatus Bathyarchaeota archaeon]|nr:prepilin peptidase [Candidatus Bathyarchaeota archaeon]